MSGTVEYRELADYPGYRVGSDGSVWSRRIPRGRDGVTRLSEEWRKLSQVRRRRHGHMRVCVCVNKKPVRLYVHRLVLEAFVGPCPEGMEACHNNGDATNNALGNLRWDTHLNNVRDTCRHGQRLAKLTEEDVLEIRRLLSRRVRQYEIAGRYGISQATVSAIATGRTWKKSGVQPSA